MNHLSILHPFLSSCNLPSSTAGMEAEAEAEDLATNVLLYNGVPIWFNGMTILFTYI